MQTSEEIAQQGCKDQNVSKVVVDRQQWKPMGSNVLVAGDSGIQKKLSIKSQKQAASFKEVAVRAVVDARVGKNAERFRETEVAESKGGAGDCIQKEVKKMSHQKQEAKPEVGIQIGEHVKYAREQS